MTPSKQKLVLAIGIVLTFAMSQTSDAQLLRFRRCVCPTPPTNHCCAQQFVAEATPAIQYQATQDVVELATPSTVEASDALAPKSVESADFSISFDEPATLELNSPVSETVGSPVVVESTPTPITTTVEAGVVYDSASDVPVVQPEASVVAPATATEEITLPVAAPTAVPVPVATGDTVIKPESAPMVDAPAQSAPIEIPAAKAVEGAAKAVEQSILDGK